MELTQIKQTALVDLSKYESGALSLSELDLIIEQEQAADAERDNQTRTFRMIRDGRRLVEGREFCERPDCGIEGKTHDQRFGEWLRNSQNFRGLNAQDRKNRMDLALAIWRSPVLEQMTEFFGTTRIAKMNALPDDRIEQIIEFAANAIEHGLADELKKT